MYIVVIKKDDGPLLFDMFESLDDDTFVRHWTKRNSGLGDVGKVVGCARVEPTIEGPLREQFKVLEALVEIPEFREALQNLFSGVFQSGVFSENGDKEHSKLVKALNAGI